MEKFELLKPDEYLTLYISYTNKAIVYRIKSVLNANYPYFLYGPLPINKGEVEPTFNGGAYITQAPGEIGPQSYTMYKQFPSTLMNVYDPSDMWYLDKSSRDEIFHIIQYVKPSWVMIEQQIPTGTNQATFQNGRVSGGIGINNNTFGFRRGVYETVQIPYIHYGWVYGNDTSMDITTQVLFKYGEYKIEIVTDPMLVYQILTRRIPSKEITLTLSSYPNELRNALISDYGFEGYPMPVIGEMSGNSYISQIQPLIPQIKEVFK